MLVSKSKKNLLNDLSLIISSSEDALYELKEIRLSGNKFSHVDEILNFFHFIIIYIQDIGVSMDLYLKCDNKLSKNLQGRLMAVICFQFIEEYSKMKGRNIRKSFQQLNDSVEYFKNELNLLDKGLKLYRRKYETYLKNIRNNTIAHRDIEMKEYYKFSKSLDSDEIFLRAGKLIMVFTKINIMYAAFCNVFNEKSE